MIIADIKTDVKQDIKKMVAVCYNFSQKYLLKLVVGIPYSLILSVKNGEDGRGGRGEGGWRVKGFSLKDQNLLSMAKVICQGFLSGWLLSLEFKIYLEKFIPCPEM